LGAIVYRWKWLTDNTQTEDGLLSRELALFTAAVVLLASGLIILVGTSAPIFGQSVETFFYNEMILPIAIIIGLLNGLSLMMKWRNTKTKDLLKKSLPSLGIALLISVLIVVFGGIDEILIMFLVFSMLFSLVVNGEIAFKIIKGNKKMLGAYVAHIGIALFILGVIGSSVNSQQVDVDLVKNETVSAFGYEMTFTSWKPIDNNTKYSFNIDVKKGDSEYQVNPVMYVSDFNNSLMRIPAILTLPTQDLYISPLGYDEAKHIHSDDGTTLSLQKGVSTEFNDVNILFTKFHLREGTMAAMQEGRDFQMGAVLTIEKNGNIEEIELLRKQISGKVEFTSFASEEFDIKIKLVKLTADNIEIALSKIAKEVEEQIAQEVLYISASIKPFISFVWIGVVVMVVGFFISVMRRLRDSLAK